jgi:hypothetical protein
MVLLEVLCYSLRGDEDRVCTGSSYGLESIPNASSLPRYSHSVYKAFKVKHKKILVTA